jgi:hypothetical protein
MPCPSGKICFPTPGAARWSVADKKRKGQLPHGRVYHCGLCGAWHLTSKRPRHRRKWKGGDDEPAR